MLRASLFNKARADTDDQPMVSISDSNSAPTMLLYYL